MQRRGKHLEPRREARLLCLALAFLGGSIALPGLKGQTPGATPPPAFEVASVKRSDPGATGGTISGPTPGQFTVRNMPLDRIILYALGIRDYQLVGGPGWIHSDRFDIVAKYPQGWPEHGPPLPLMLRTLLEDRFKLKMHADTREGPTYGLVMAKSDRKLGPKLHPSTVDCAALIAARGATRPGAPFAPVGPPPCLMVSTGNSVRGDTRTMGMLAGVLSARVGRPVIDRTELPGNFTFELEWSPVLAVAAPIAGQPPPVDDQTSIFTALQEQLGLKLQSERGSIDVWVIDGADPPAPD